MGRTPLFRLLQRAAAIARAAQQSRMPLDEVHAQLQVRRIDCQRRRLLQGAGAGVLLAGCASAPRILPPTQDRRADCSVAVAPARRARAGV